jgi:hypothetical protein
MPKILINEKDRTSPGAPAGYTNFAVLITGFMGQSNSSADPAKLVKPDGNGVYEFSSSEDFRDTIGLVPPVLSKEDLEVSHYGNQMAYELLKQGYSIIYKPLLDENANEGRIKFNTATNGAEEEEIKVLDNNIADLIAAIEQMTNESFWEAFKDKANYDFRFITHGLLRSSAGADVTELNRKKQILNDRIEDLRNTLDELKACCTKPREFDRDIANQDFEKIVEKDSRYTDFRNGIGQYDAGLIFRGTYENDQITEASKAIQDEILALTFTNDEGEEVTFGYDEDNDGIVDTKYLTYAHAVKYVTLELEDFLTKHAENEATIRTEKNKGLTTAELNDINSCIADLATYIAAGTGKNTYNDFNSEELPGRGDCIALIELDENLYVNTTSTDKPESLIIEAINSSDINHAAVGKYCALTVPSVVYKMSDDEAFDNNKTFPGAFHYLACFMNSLKLGFAEWYAAAGYTRGVSSYTIDYTAVKLGEIAINALEPRNKINEKAPNFACNVIANFRGSYYLWGNRTAHSLGDINSPDTGDLVASHFLNIRQLCTTIKKQLYVACRRFTFDPNSDTLWFNFVNAIKPTLEAMKADQGIRDYKILKVTDNPKKATLRAKIRIIPIEAVEDFDLEVSLEDSFGETTASVTE